MIALNFVCPYSFFNRFHADILIYQIQQISKLLFICNRFCIHLYQKYDFKPYPISPCPLYGVIFNFGIFAVVALTDSSISIFVVSFVALPLSSFPIISFHVLPVSREVPSFAFRAVVVVFLPILLVVPRIHVPNPVACPGLLATVCSCLELTINTKISNPFSIVYVREDGRLFSVLEVLNCLWLSGSTAHV